jgi:hypothetical protein
MELNNSKETHGTSETNPFTGSWAEQLQQSSNYGGGGGEITAPGGSELPENSTGHVPQQFAMARAEEERQADPRLMSPKQIRAYALQGGLSEIAEIARRAIDIDNSEAIAWPEPLSQQDISCQTVAVINGIRCYQAATEGRVMNPSFAEIAHIRRAAGILEGRPDAFTADSIARLFKKIGLLTSAMDMQQPITAIEKMGSNRGFAVVTSGEAWHATTVVPNLARLATSSGTIPDLISIDSLAGRQTGMSVQEFCAVMIQQDWQRQDQTLICTM